MNPNCKIAQGFMIRLDFQNCNRYLNLERKSNPENTAIDFVELKSMALKILINENHSGLEDWERRYKYFDQGLKKQNLTGKLTYLCRAELLLLKGFLNVRKENYVTAVRDFNNAHTYFTEGQKRYPDYLDLEKGVALMKILIGVVPSEYQWALKLLGYEGELTRGLEDLKRIIDQTTEDSTSLYLREESLFLYVTLYSNFGKRNGELSELILNNRVWMLRNPLLRYAFTSALLKEKNAKIALDCFGPEPVNVDLPHLAYLKGYLFLLTGKNNAEHWFNYFLKIHSGNMLKASSYQKLSWIYYLNSNLEKAREANLKIKTLKSFPTDEDLQAKNAASQPFPAKCLLRSRLNFDGGFFQKSLKDLLSCAEGELKTTAEHIEFLYRLGRVHQKLGNAEKSIHCFDLTIKSGTGHKSYYAPAAALYAGNLMEDSGNAARAKYYYSKVFDFKGYPYERSLSQKAKAGISRLNKSEMAK